MQHKQRRSNLLTCVGEAEDLMRRTKNSVLPIKMGTLIARDEELLRTPIQTKRQSSSQTSEKQKKKKKK